MASTSNGAHASSSDEEPERSVDAANESKRARRRRGRRTRKKSERDSPCSEMNRSPEPLIESRKRTCSLGAPPAPRNTNDFLLEDMEKREEDGLKRQRRESCNGGASPQQAERGDEEELPGEDEFEDQYEESWQECVVDKYKEMSHDELARRMAIMEKNRDEVERKLRWERSKSDYLQERLLEAEEQIRSNQDEDAADAADAYDPPSPPPPPVPSMSSSSYVQLPMFPSSVGNCSPFAAGGGCSPNVISSPRA